MSSTSSTECPLCRNATIAFRLEDTSFHRCVACGFTFKDARHHLADPLEKARYDCHSTVPDAGYAQRMERFLDTCAYPFATAGTAIDFGCGRTGTCLRLLREKGFSAVGYDPHYAPDAAVLQTTYDLVVAVEVVEHFRDPEAGWGMIASLARPGAVIAVSTLFVPADFAAWWYRRDVTHYGFYTPEALEAVAARFGFTLAATDGKSAVAYVRR